MKLLLSTQSEFRKLRRTAALRFGFVCIAIIGILVFFSYTTDVRDMQSLYGDPWNIFMENRKPSLQLLYLPMFSILLTAFAAQVEFRNNTWKQVHSSPQSLLHVSLSKLAIIWIIILLFIVLFNVLMLGILLILDIIHPSINLEAHRLNLGNWVKTMIQANLSIAAMTVLQFWLAYLIRNFIIVIAIGVSLWISAAYLLFEEHWKYADWFPYSFPITMISKTHEHITWEICLRSAGFAVLFFVMGQILYTRKKKLL